MDIDNLRQQHRDLEDMAASIMTRIHGYRDEFDAITLARSMANLAVLLRVHFAFEDTALYPAMLTSGDAEAAQLGLRLKTEVGDLADRFDDFIRRWQAPTTIAAAFEEFRDEVTSLFAVLGARIEQENDLLFPAAERLRRDLAA